MKMRVIAVTTAGFLTIVAGQALAGPRDDVLEAMGKCTTLTDDKARLACYDAAAPRLRDALNQPPETLAHPPTEEEQKSWFGFNIGNWFNGNAPPEAQTKPGEFGGENLPAKPAPSESAAASPQPVEINSITATVTEYSFNPFGKFIVFLDNGQVWKEIDTGTAHFIKGGPNTVRIERGMLGSYNLYVNDSNKLFKVTRVK